VMTASALHLCTSVECNAVRKLWLLGGGGGSWQYVANSNISTVGLLVLQMSVAMEAHLPPCANCMPIVRHTHNSQPWQARTSQNGVAKLHDVMKERRHGKDVTAGELVL